MFATWRRLAIVGGSMPILAGVLQALSATDVASMLADAAIPDPIPRALVGAWIFLGWHTLLIGGIAIGAVVKPGPGATFHHWSSGVSPATPLGHKGIVVGAQALAATILDLFLEPTHLEAVRTQFEEDTKDVTWTSLIPDGTTPPIELNADKMKRFRPLLSEFEYDFESGKTYIEQLGIEYPTVRDP